MIKTASIEVTQAIQDSALACGSLIPIEFEDGAVRDFQRLFDEITAADCEYFHVWTALLGPSLTVPFVNQQLTLGTWQQQIVYMDFDNRARQRSLVVQIIGE